jgi:hypothetical protein
MLDFTSDSLYIGYVFKHNYVSKILLLLILLAGIFLVGAFSGLIQGKNLYSEEELLKKFPVPTPGEGGYPDFVSTEPEKYEIVFYSLTSATELGKFAEKPYSYIGRDNRIIDSAIYLAHGNSLLKFDLIANQTSKIYEILSDEAFLSIKYDSEKKLFYLTTYKTQEKPELDSHQQLIRFNPVSSEVNEIVSFNPGIYSVIKHLFTMGDTEVIYTEGGETCGGGGTIFTVQNKNKTIVKDYGIGCMEGSRLLGADSATNSLIMAEAVMREENLSKANTKRIFRKSVVDGSEHTLFTLPDGAYYEQELTDEKKIVFKSDTSVLLYDLNSGTQQSFPLVEEVFKQGHLQVIRKNTDHCLVSEDYKEKKLSVYCLESGTKESFNYAVLDLQSPHVFGYFGDQFIVSAAKEKES